jgi:acyl-CoA synthetase (AMP-forming)/AMP-acid ligase II/acyl carrier protein
LRTANGQMHYAELQSRIARLAGLFHQMELRTGDRAVIVSKNDSEAACLVLAMLCSGITAAIGDNQSSRDEVAALIVAANPDAVFVDAEYLDANGGPPGIPPSRIAVIGPTSHKAASSAGYGAAIPGSLETVIPCEEFSAPPEETLALLVFTSGTTSQPKGVCLTHGNIAAQQDIFESVYGFDAESRILNVLPMHHVDGLIRGPLAALWCGGTVVRPQRFDVSKVQSLLSAVAAERATHLVTVPAMLDIINRLGDPSQEPFSTPAFRFVISSADLLDEKLWNTFETRFKTVIVNAYGLSEVVCDALFCGPGADTRLVGSLGKPVGCQARVINGEGQDCRDEETGELILSGPTVMRGYFNQPEETARVLREGWFHTGDLVRRDARGYFHFEGRNKTIVKVGGVTIHPESVNSVIRAMPGIVEAVTFGQPDPVRGQRLVACAVADPAWGITPADVQVYCRKALVPIKVPSEIILLDRLPRGAAGKIALEELKAIVAGMASEATGGTTVFEIAAQCFNVPVASLSSESSPYNTPGWDSFAHLELIAHIEQRLGIQFSAEDIINLGSLGDAISIVDAQSTAANRPDRNPNAQR